jgi:hypothetical protein
MLGGFSSIHHELNPPWSLQQLLGFGAEPALVAACNSVAQLVRQHGIERQLLGLLHTTLLDIFDLLCAAEANGGETNTNGGFGAANGSSSSSNRGGAQVTAHTQQQTAGQQQAAQAAASSSSSSSSSGWPAALVAAHMGVVIEVGAAALWRLSCLQTGTGYDVACTWQ